MEYISRFKAFAPLTPFEELRLVHALDAITRLAVNSHVEPISCPLIIASGFVGLVQTFFDGTWCVLKIGLPGDIIHPLHRESVQWQALTPTRVLEAPSESGCPGLTAAYQLSTRIDLLNYEAQILRLSAMSSARRYADFLIEVDARLTFIGHTSGKAFHLPLSQVLIANLLGMTPIHLNRTRRLLSNDGMVSFDGRSVTLSTQLAKASVDRQRLLLQA